MGFVMICLGIYLITVSAVLTDVTTNSLPMDTEGEVTAINSQIAIAKEGLQIQEQKSKLDDLVVHFRSDSASIT